MIIVKERKAVPHADVRCDNCGSLLQYGNADLHVDNQRHNVRYYFDCPVCGCKVNANWIIKEEKKVKPKEIGLCVRQKKLH